MTDCPGEEYNLLMPFVVVTSTGGPFDDAAFVAGWQCAQIREALSHSGASWSGTVRAAVIPQLDLIAMERGLTVSSVDTGDGWTFVSVTAPGEGDELRRAEQ